MAQGRVLIEHRAESKWNFERQARILYVPSPSECPYRESQKLKEAAQTSSQALPSILKQGGSQPQFRKSISQN